MFVTSHTKRVAQEYRRNLLARGILFRWDAWFFPFELLFIGKIGCTRIKLDLFTPKTNFIVCRGKLPPANQKSDFRHDWFNELAYWIFSVVDPSSFLDVLNKHMKWKLWSFHKFPSSQIKACECCSIADIGFFFFIEVVKHNTWSGVRSKLLLMRWWCRTTV